MESLAESERGYKREDGHGLLVSRSGRLHHYTPLQELHSGLDLNIAASTSWDTSDSAVQDTRDFEDTHREVNRTTDSYQLSNTVHIRDTRLLGQ